MSLDGFGTTSDHMGIYDITHPEYDTNALNWFKWRLVMEGGRWFVDRYLQKFSQRETNDDFILRKGITYPPTFAKAALNEIKNSIYQRMIDIVRVGGSKSYQDSLMAGVDTVGSSMNNFIGCRVLPELLAMGKVGVYVDMPVKKGETLFDNLGHKPYLYIYRVEDIRSWVFQDHTQNLFGALLLRDTVYGTEEIYGYPVNVETHFRRIWKEDGVVKVQMHNEEGNPVDEETTLDIPEIPFVLFQISDSLLKDIADYQIALLNITSSDINYILKSNFPFYIEQYDPIVEGSNYVRNASYDDPHITIPVLDPSENPASPFVPLAATQSQSNIAATREIQTGVAAGRRYPKGIDAPSFIHPSSEPLKASMEKQEQMKAEIRLLLNLSINNLRPVRASEQSKVADDRTLLNGLSYVGLELQAGERQIAKFWSMYENTKDYAEITYPPTYEIISEEERLKQAKEYQEFLSLLPSTTYQKNVGKIITKILLASKIKSEELDKIYAELDASPNMTSDPKTITMDLENGLVSDDLASKLRGYPKGEVEKAKQDHADRLARIAIAQSEGAAAARGVGDASAGSAKAEKQMPQADGTPQNVRGEGNG